MDENLENLRERARTTARRLFHTPKGRGGYEERGAWA